MRMVRVISSLVPSNIHHCFFIGTSGALTLHPFFFLHSGFLDIDVLV